MALRETLELDVQAARRQIGQLETALDSLATTIDIDVGGNAEAEIRSIDDRLDEVVRSSERLATEMTAVALEAGRAEIDVRGLARALDISEDEATALASEVLSAQVQASRLEDAARDTARSLGLADDEAEKFSRELQRAARHADDVDNRSRTLVSTFGQLRTVVAGVAGVVATIGIGRGIANAVQGARAAVTEFSRLNESINAVEVVFGRASNQIFKFGEVSAKSAGLSRQAFQESVVPIGAVLTNFGFSAEEAADASILLVQRAADLASVLNTDVNDALLAINSALVGQVEPLRKYGAEISQARVEQFALAEGIIKTKSEMDTAATVQARLGLILQDTARVQGDFVNTSDEFANASRIARAEFEQLASDIGEALLPAFEAILANAPEIIAAFEGMVPAITDAAGAIADFTEGLSAGGNFQLFLELLRQIPGVAFDVQRSIQNLGIGGLASFVGAGELANDQMEELGRRVDNVRIRGERLRLIFDLRQGIPAVEAFSEAVRRLGQRSDSLVLLSDAFDDLAALSGLDDRELAAATVELIRQADQLGLNQDAVFILRNELALLNDELRSGEGPIRSTTDRFGEMGAELPEVASRFTIFVSELEELPPRLSGVAAAFATLDLDLDPFEGAAEEIEVSAQEFFDNLAAQVEQGARTQALAAELIARGFVNVGREILEAGPGAGKAAEEFLNNLDLAEKAERLLAGEGTAIANQIGKDLASRLRSAELSEDAQAALVTLIQEGMIDSPQVLQALIGAGTDLSNDFSGAWRDGMRAEEEAIAQFTEDSINTALGNVDVSDGVEQLRRAMQDQLSNIQLAIDAGQIQITGTGNLQITGSADTLERSGGGGGDVVVNNNIYYPNTTDPATTSAQVAQATAASATYLNRALN